MSDDVARYYHTPEGMEQARGDESADLYVLADDYQNLRSEYGDFQEHAERGRRSVERKLARRVLQLEQAEELLRECQTHVPGYLSDEIEEALSE